MNARGFLVALLLTNAFALHAQSSATPSMPAVWQMQNSGTTASLRGIVSVDGLMAWASGTGGTVLRTLDGGQHWQKCTVPDADKDGATLDFRGVQAWDADTAIVMASGPGYKSRLYKTTDGCRTWKLLFTNPDKDGFWDALSVADQANLLLLGDPVAGMFTVIESVDGGLNWKKQKSSGLASRASEGAFAASNSSALVNWVDGFFAFGTGSEEGARVFTECETCSADLHWKQVVVPGFSRSKSAGIFSLGARDGRQWIAVGGDYTKPNEASGTAAYTLDGGLHWAAAEKPPHGYRSTVQWWEAEKLWITAGTNGSDSSSDNGRTWQALDDGNWNALSLPFIVGPKGRIARIDTEALRRQAGPTR